MQNSETNSANSASQPESTPETSDAPTRAIAHRRIDGTCIAEMAKLCAKMLTESEACRRLGIRPRAWFDWKSRCGRTQKFADLLEAYRADRIEGLIDRIEKSADGVGLKFPDWRAAFALLKITDLKRFGESAPAETTVNQTAIVVKAGGTDELRRMIERYAGLAAAQMKALPPAGSEKKALTITSGPESATEPV